ncbi:MAG: putative aminohydrolase SsnA [Ignavibacteriales bacterium]|nr:putative aminohydrolase SsnA [Ignavibacteriales bacterium]
MNFLLRNVKIISLDPLRIEEADIRIIDGTIADCGKSLRPKKSDEVINLSGKIILPGFVNSHTHLYSALSRGMPAPKTAPRNFIEILQKVWWKLDEALDEEAIYYSALVGAIEAVKFGTTTLIDHHASPNHISGSLDLTKSGIAKVGLRGVVCYETTDRGGMKKRDLGLEENERFITENANNPHFRGTMGGHASFTLCNDSLRKLGELASLYDCGVHIHVAEDKADVLDSMENYNTDIISRLNELGILRKKSIFAHGVHLNQKQFARVEKAGAWMVHNPRSNMNNAVGYAPLNWYGEHSALGTDGFPADMFDEAKFGYFRNAESDHRTEFSRLPVMLNNGQKLISQFFGRSFGTLAKNSPADLVVLDYKLPTPMISQNIYGHFLFGMNSPMVQHVMIDGNWIVWNRQMMGIDEDAVMEKARKVAARLWKSIGK